MAQSEVLTRKSYGLLEDATEMPNLLDVQVRSFEDFLQKDLSSQKRSKQGLQSIFEEIFPVTDVR
ncbi:MAG: hypothetical protein OEV68_18310, partial [candidate division Zixibacteria bacterium]|nr:hypothetical protein [candidate division Zixibacteria bacterium]